MFFKKNALCLVICSMLLSLVLCLSACGSQGEPGVPGEKGDTGATGKGISSIEKTETSGLVDTYTITFTDDTATTFTVTNAPEEPVHTFGEWETVQEPMYRQYGLKVRICADCGEEEFALIEKGDCDHIYDTVVTPPTCISRGFTTYTCVICGDTYVDDILEITEQHNYVDGVCSACGERLPAYKRINNEGGEDEEGEYLLFGMYPQSIVTDSDVKATLSSMAGTLPTSDNTQNWISYGYYINDTNSTDYMWYIDLEYNDEKYRGVYFTSYRPRYTSDSSTANESRQDENGYIPGNVYWFRYEPIKWRILSEADGEALVLCEMIIDSQEFRSEHDGYKIYLNYGISTVREWLNNSFYNTAFTRLEKSVIELTTVDNSKESTNPDGNPTAFNNGENPNVCVDTKDYIFLLSEQEVTKSEYGFKNYNELDENRKKMATDYAQSQGVYTDINNYRGNVYWLLRSLMLDNGLLFVRAASVSGSANGFLNYFETDSGVCPALRIRLDE